MIIIEQINRRVETIKRHALEEASVVWIGLIDDRLAEGPYPRVKTRVNFREDGKSCNLDRLVWTITDPIVCGFVVSYSKDGSPFDNGPLTNMCGGPLNLAAFPYQSLWVQPGNLLW